MDLESPTTIVGFHGGSVVWNSPANTEDVGSILVSGKFPGKVNGNSLQYSCLGNPMDGGAGGLQSMQLDTT